MYQNIIKILIYSATIANVYVVNQRSKIFKKIENENQVREQIIIKEIKHIIYGTFMETSLSA